MRKRQLYAISNGNRFKKAFPTDEDFLRAFTADKQSEVVADERKCLFGSFPTLAQVNVIYGNKAAQKWLVKMLTDVEGYFGFNKKLNVSQLTELPTHIFNNSVW